MSHSLNVCSNLIGVIIAARTNAPGSWHDSCVAQPIYQILHEKTPDGYYIIADTAFPRGTMEIKGHIHASLKDVGINQIHTVYFKHWKQTDDDIEVWTAFKSMLFSQQWEKDRVA
ncbi:hypothetical protein PAXRUDRAFT_158675 [Paxillus rubicundulus Ve08.2h10]|uniref:DDE Tnp4 domain-containing protein n=1 Tax=Paxillus rubicundulus Ve08.2h10 TaxID=930991 RepID=A0A0D0DGQ2_9AGAM|nr:hypothetical protein PAXRUDRAFT_158675 [Paxillus rubicundulus Ve08.2h10]